MAQRTREDLEIGVRPMRAYRRDPTALAFRHSSPKVPETGCFASRGHRFDPGWLHSPSSLHVGGF